MSRFLVSHTFYDLPLGAIHIVLYGRPLTSITQRALPNVGFAIITEY